MFLANWVDTFSDGGIPMSRGMVIICALAVGAFLVWLLLYLTNAADK